MTQAGFVMDCIRLDGVRQCFRQGGGGPVLSRAFLICGGIRASWCQDQVRLCLVVQSCAIRGSRVVAHLVFMENALESALA